MQQQRPPADFRSSVTAAVNDSIVRMKTVGRLRVLKRDRAMQRPPSTPTTATGDGQQQQQPMDINTWLASLAKQWSESNDISSGVIVVPSSEEATKPTTAAAAALKSEADADESPASFSTAASSPEVSPRRGSMTVGATTNHKHRRGITTTSSTAAPNAVVELPSSLLELYASMASNGISFIGRYEAPSLTSVEKLFPSFGITACGVEPMNPFTVPNPAQGTPITTPSSTTPTSPTAPSPSSSTFTPVCMCHLNAIQRIEPIAVTLLEVLGDEEEDGRISNADNNGEGAAADGASTAPSATNSSSSKGDALPFDKADRYFTLWSADEGAQPAHSNCTSGDGTGVSVVLRYCGLGSCKEPEVWAWVAVKGSEGDGSKKNANTSTTTATNGILFYVSKTFVDFVKVGCLRYCWARMWPLLLAPAVVREQVGLGFGPDGKVSDCVATMRPWLEVFGGKPIEALCKDIKVVGARVLVE